MKIKERPNRKIIQPKALLIGALWALIILSFRMMLTNNYYFFFLPWNLFLAFVPLFMAYKAEISASQKKSVWLFFWITLWLFFFPNAPYVITDFLHLAHYYNSELFWGGLYSFDPSGTPNWIFLYDFLMIGFYTVLSWVAGLCSFQSILKNHLLLVGKQWKQVVFFLGSLTLSGFGIFLGRFLRFNSWDIVARPFHILQSISEVFTNGFILHLAVFTTVCFVILFIVTYVFFDSKFEFMFARLAEESGGKKIVSNGNRKKTELFY